MPPARAWFGVGCHGPQRPALCSEPPGHGSNGERGAPTCDGWPRASALPCAGRRRAAACGARPAAGSRSRCEPQPSHLTASFRVHERHGNTCKPPAGPVGWSICARTAQRRSCSPRALHQAAPPARQRAAPCGRGASVQADLVQIPLCCGAPAGAEAWVPGGDGPRPHDGQQAGGRRAAPSPLPPPPNVPLAAAAGHAFRQSRPPHSCYVP